MLSKFDHPKKTALLLRNQFISYSLLAKNYDLRPDAPPRLTAMLTAGCDILKTRDSCVWLIPNSRTAQKH
jgi:hypothetical protein